MNVDIRDAALAAAHIACAVHGDGADDVTIRITSSAVTVHIPNRVSPLLAEVLWARVAKAINAHPPMDVDDATVAVGQVYDVLVVLTSGAVFDVEVMA